MMKEKIFVAMAFVLTFAAGVLTGALVVREFALPPFAPMGMPRASGRELGLPLELLQRRLDLSESQRQRIAAIFKKYQEQIREHLQQTRPWVHDTMQQMRREIESVLTLEQREKYQKELSRLERRPRRQGPPPDTLPH
jgi:Spy/CpxP family protein refolding chaperone